MKTFYKIIFFLLGLAAVIACREELPWENEQYEKMIYVLCDNSSKVYDAEYHFDGSVNVQYISLLYSGTHEIGQSVDIILRDDTVLYDKYNKTNFDIDTASYAKIFSKEKYTIPSYRATISPGEFNTLVPVYVEKEDLVDLSPDSIYFIPLAIDQVSAYTKNPENYNVLFRIYARNAYASMLTQTNYRLKGFRKVEDGSGGGEKSVSLNDKLFVPLSANAVRCAVGIQSYNAKSPETILRYGMVIQVHEDNSITLHPYHDGYQGVIIEQLEPPTDLEEDEIFLYDNTYEVEEKRFRMYYRYKVWEVFNEGEADEYGDYSDWVIMKEIDQLNTDLEENEGDN